MDKLIYDNGESILIKVKDVKEVFNEYLNQMIENDCLDEENIKYYKECIKENLEAIKDLKEDKIVCFTENPMAGFYCYDADSLEEIKTEMEAHNAQKTIKNTLESLTENYFTSIIEEWNDWKKDAGASRRIDYESAVTYIKDEFDSDYDLDYDKELAGLETDAEVAYEIIKIIKKYKSEDFENFPDKEILIIR